MSRMNTFENNRVSISGFISSELVLDHEAYGEKFYTVDVNIERLSGTVDVVKVIVSDRLVDVSQNYIGWLVNIKGQIRTYNKNTIPSLAVRVFAQEFKVEFEEVPEMNNNEVCLIGELYRTPIFRTAPKGKDLTELKVEVCNPYGRKNRIPCIAWGRTAHYAATLEIGTKVKIVGRLQSRPYTKRLDDGTFAELVAFEVSVCQLVVEGEV